LFVNVAPEPALAGLGGGDDRVLGGAKVPGGVLVLGGVAAADVAAFEASAEMHPAVAQRDALLADMDFGRGILRVGKVFAESHGGMVAERQGVGSSLSSGAGDLTLLGK
jgi:hypothetical protein